MSVHCLLCGFDNVPTAAVFNVCVFLWLLCGVQHGFAPLRELKTGHEAMRVATMYTVRPMTALPIITMAVSVVLQREIMIKALPATVYSISSKKFFRSNLSLNSTQVLYDQTILIKCLKCYTFNTN